MRRARAWGEPWAPQQLASILAIKTGSVCQLLRSCRAMGATARLASLGLLAARCLLLVTALQTGLQQGGQRGGGLWTSGSGTSGGAAAVFEPAALSDARSTMRGAINLPSPLLARRMLSHSRSAALPAAPVCRPGTPAFSIRSLVALLQAGLVMDQGYPLEEHFVTTADGYVLGMFRIPWGTSDAPAAAAGPRQSSWGSSGSSDGGSSSSSGGSMSGGVPSPVCRPPVLLLHGVLDSSAAWVLNRPEQSLGFILADAGYDVWLGGC